MHIGYATTFQNPHRARPDKDVWADELYVTDLVIECGFDSVWSTEHHFTDYEMIPSPLQYLSYVAGRSATIRLGTMVVVLPWNDPLRVVEEVTVLDNITNGRFILGIGRGICQLEFDGMRIPMEESRGRFNESAQVILSALETGVIESDPSGFFKIPRREIRPDPLYSFKGRTFGAGGSITSMPIMAGLGIGLLLVPVKEWEDIDEELALYNQSWAESHPDVPLPMHLLDQFIIVDEDPIKARDLAAEYIGSYFSEVMKHYGFANSQLGDTKGYEAYKQFTDSVAAGTEKVIAGMVDRQAWGTPAEVLERLRAARDRVNASTLLGHFLFGGMSREICEPSVRLFTEKVLPVVRSWGPDVFTNPTPLKLDRSVA